jgi:ClpP class serine protease
MTADVMAGDMFSGSEAINVGLADGMMTFNQAINRLQTLKK